MMDIARIFNFSEVEHKSEPFEYFIGRDLLRVDLSSHILDWMETHAPWKLTKKDFYEQYEFDFIDTQLPNSLQFLQEPATFSFLRKKMEDTFGFPMKEKVDLVAHKLVTNQTIRIHNDNLDEGEACRLLIQLNRSWDKRNGGFLMFFNSPDPKDIHRIIMPVHNSFAGFRISKDSNHAVSTINRGERFTLVYSFYGS